LVALIARSFAVYLTILAVWDASYLAEVFYSAWHYLQESPPLREHQYWIAYYRLRTVLSCLRIIGAMMAARFFWNAGPGAEKLFASVGNGQAGSNPNHVNNLPL
jgi:hypothetical protein